MLGHKLFGDPARLCCQAGYRVGPLHLHQTGEAFIVPATQFTARIQLLAEGAAAWDVQGKDPDCEHLPVIEGRVVLGGAEAELTDDRQWEEQ